MADAEAMLKQQVQESRAQDEATLKRRCEAVSWPLSGPPGLARNNIEDSVISGMLISEFIILYMIS